MAHVSGNPAWQNKPNKTTPITAGALENIEVALDDLDLDTGKRAIASANGTGSVYVRRVGAEVSLYFRDVQDPSAGASPMIVAPEGFRPDQVPLYGLLARTGGRQLVTLDVANTSGEIRQGTPYTSAMYGLLRWQTSDPWPSKPYPGTPI